MSAPMFDYLAADIDGCRALVVTPTISESASPAVREGLARRRLSMITGECPCGGRRASLNRAQRRAARRRNGEISTLRIEHESDCPAICPEVEHYMLGWRWAR